MVAEKLFEIQGLDLQLVKDAEANYGGYATLGAVLDLLRPVLQERGLLLLQTVEGVYLKTMLISTEDGDSLESSMLLVMDKQTSQGLGSAITYARRYSLTTMFNLDAEDDDGAEASVPKTKKKVVASDKSDQPKTRAF